jgi:hypothetical protein
MSIKNLKPQFGKFKQGYYKLENPTKYLGDQTKVIFRSSWEFKIMKYCDLSPHINEWSSEPIGIKYVSPLDNKEHRYYVDFYIRVVKPNGESVKYLAEVKPTKDYLNKPVMEGRKTPKRMSRYVEEMKTYIVNNAKFHSAEKYANSLGMVFIKINENNIKQL